MLLPFVTEEFDEEVPVGEVEGEEGEGGAGDDGEGMEGDETEGEEVDEGEGGGRGDVEELEVTEDAFVDSERRG